MTKYEPEYDLGEIHYLIEERQRDITNTVKTTSHQIGFSETDIYNEILALDNSNFLHSVEGKFDHIYQDVYTKTIRNVPVYIKFKKIGKYGDKVLVLSFKRNTSVR